MKHTPNVFVLFCFLYIVNKLSSCNIWPITRLYNGKHRLTICRELGVDFVNFAYILWM